jgi:hypothetical protein
MESASSQRLEAALRHLRGLFLPCEPPVGAGSFDVLFANTSEVVVWYSPAREGHRAGEVTISCKRLAAALDHLANGQPLDETALERIGGSPARGRWLLAVLAQLPEVSVLSSPLALVWAPAETVEAHTPEARGETT